jgi:hypothetical protein
MKERGADGRPPGNSGHSQRITRVMPTRCLALILLLSLGGWAQEPQLVPVAHDHLKDGRFLFEWGSMENPPGTSWNYELNVPSDRWHYAAIQVDRKHVDKTRICHLYVLPPEPLDAKKAEDWYKALLPDASPARFFKSSNPQRPSFWSPIKGPDFKGTLVLTATPEALYCWEELGPTETPRDFPRWLSTFKPSDQKQRFEDLRTTVSGQLEEHDGRIQVEAGQFRSPAQTVWVQAKIAAKDLELYKGTRMQGETMDVFALAVYTESHNLSQGNIEAMVDGMASSMGQKKGNVQIDESQADRMNATFQIGDSTGYAQNRLTPAGVVMTLGFGPKVQKSEVIELAESFQPSAQKIQQSKTQSHERVQGLSFKLTLFAGLIMSSLMSSAKKARTRAASKFWQIMMVVTSLGLSAFLVFYSGQIADRFFDDHDRGISYLFGTSLVLAAAGPVGVLWVRKHRPGA